MNTFYSRTQDKDQSILIVEDDYHHVFGAFFSEAWTTSKRFHYGSGETFLFKIRPEFKVFRWTKLNDYFMLSARDFIAVGGGEEAGYGLWLDAEFEHGSSSMCDTFANETLAHAVDFKVLRLEVWTVLHATWK